jgi:DNA-binding MarR family transcriptional regulator
MNRKTASGRVRSNPAHPPVSNSSLKAKAETIPSTFDLWVIMDSAHFAISRSRFLEIAQFGLTPEKAQILHILQTNANALAQSRLSDYTMRQHHSVSSLINRMIKEGLLKKVKYPGERTFTVLTTKKGKDKYSKLTRVSVDMIFSSLSAEERRKLFSLLSHLLDKSRDLLGIDYEPPFLKASRRVSVRASTTDQD